MHGGIKYYSRQLQDLKYKCLILDKIFIIPHKKFCSTLKSSYLLGKRIENDILVVEKNCLRLKSHFPSISQVNICFFSGIQKFLPGTKMILSGQKDEALVCCFSNVLR